LYFCILIQPILNDCAAAFPNVKLYAYMDDVTLTSTDSFALRAAFGYLRGRFNLLNLNFNMAKCEWLGPDRCPDELRTAGVTTVVGVIKVVGVFIGSDECAAEKLVGKLDKHECLFTRLKNMKCSLQSWLILKRCGLPRHTFFMRTHPPHVTERSCTVFDARVLDVVRHWTEASITS